MSTGDFYDTMQVCLAGHQVTAYYDTSPEDRKEYCSTCGAKTIVTCQACGARIKGHHHIRNVLYVGGDEVPRHCDNCGAAYPWVRQESHVPQGGPSEESSAQPAATASAPAGHSAATGTPFLLKLVVYLAVGLVVIVVAAFVAYLGLGLTSVGYYQPPIGQVMAFVYNVAEVGGVACTAVFALAVLLHQMPRFRKRIEELLGG